MRKNDIERALYLLSTKIREEYGANAKVDITIVGGAAIALSHEFRESTMDIDAVITFRYSLADLYSQVAKDLDLPEDWINSNVTVTMSYSNKILEYTKRYGGFGDNLNVFVVDDLTLICMKSVSCRPASHDMEDIVNLLDANPSITFSMIQDRFKEYYPDWSYMSADAQLYLISRFNVLPEDIESLLEDMERV